MAERSRSQRNSIKRRSFRLRSMTDLKKIVFIKSYKAHSDSLAAFIKSYKARSDSPTAFIKSYKAHSDSLAAFVKSYKAYSDSPTAFIKSYKPHSDSPTAFIKLWKWRSESLASFPWLWKGRSESLAGFPWLWKGHSESLATFPDFWENVILSGERRFSRSESKNLLLFFSNGLGLWFSGLDSSTSFAYAHFAQNDTGRPFCIRFIGGMTQCFHSAYCRFCRMTRGDHSALSGWRGVREFCIFFDLWYDVFYEKDKCNAHS